MALKVEISSVDQFDDIQRDRGYDIQYRQLSRDPFQATMVFDELEGWVASREWMTGPVEICVAESEGYLTILCPLADGEFHINGIRADDGVVFFLVVGQENRIVTSGDAGARVLRVPRNAVEKAIGANHIDLRRQTPYGFKAINLGRQTLQHLESTIDRALDPAPGVSCPDQSVHRRLVELLPTVLQSQAALPEPSRKTAGHLLFEALDFIDARLADPFAIEDLSDSLNIGARSLQRVFSQLIGTTPTQYIESRRMNMVRRQLLAADPTSAKVSDIALAMGCRHLGRFSSAYRVRFGEQPRETLRRSCA